MTLFRQTSQTVIGRDVRLLEPFQFPDDLLNTLLTHAQEAGSSVEGFIEETIRDALEQSVAEDTLVEGLLNLAIMGVENIEAKAEFSLDDVGAEGDWSQMTGGERKSLGRRFRKWLKA
jgi:hypothetical protein